MRRVEGAAATEQRLDLAVAAAAPELSRAQAARLIKDGRVSVAGVPVDRPGARIAAGTPLTIELPPPAPASAVAQDLPLRIVYQDEALAVVDKAPGMVVHPSAGHADGTLVNALLYHLDDLSGVGGEERPGIVHRLDRGTSGLLVVAKTDVAHRSLAEQFAAHTAGRIYLAWVHDPPDTDRGTITSVLARHPRERLRFASLPAGEDPSKGFPLAGARDQKGRRAVTHWELRARAGTVGLVSCRLETGRTHQVRVHLSELGSPLLGDGLYARRSASPVPARLRGLVAPGDERPLLHAWRLLLRHPTRGEALEFLAEPPSDFRAVADALGIALP